MPTINPAAAGLTDAQNDVYQIIVRRQANHLVTTAGDVKESYRDKDRAWIYRLLKALIGKGLIERYGRNFYRLAAEKTD